MKTTQLAAGLLIIATGGTTWKESPLQHAQMLELGAIQYLYANVCSLLTMKIGYTVLYQKSKSFYKNLNFLIHSICSTQ